MSRLVKISSAISRLLPESRMKEWVRSLFHKHIYPLHFGKTTLCIGTTCIMHKRTLFPTNNYHEIVSYNRYYTPKKDDVVIDCGAFYGIYALYAAKKHLGLQVLYIMEQ